MTEPTHLQPPADPDSRAMDFRSARRQQYMLEQTYADSLSAKLEASQHFQSHPLGVGQSSAHQHALARRSVADDLTDLLLLRYTGGQSIDALRADLEKIVAALETFAAESRQLSGTHEPALQFPVLDDYCQLMQLIGLCFLLHRRDLLGRLSRLQDGPDGGAGGVDTLYEEFMAYGLGPETRFESDWLCHKRPFEALFHALTEQAPEEALKGIEVFLKRWYKDLSGTAWHDTHKSDNQGHQGGYYGYWSFESGAAVILLGIEDDSILHRHVYYPKDLVAWCRANAALAGEGRQDALRLRCTAAQPCPKEGMWFTPARPDSRRQFALGELMPDVNGSFGATIWQFDAS